MSQHSIDELLDFINLQRKEIQHLEQLVKKQSEVQHQMIETIEQQKRIIDNR